nr:hypothetical protein [Nitrospirota bacterium]
MSRKSLWRLLAALVLLGPLSGCGFATFSRLSFNDPIKPEDVAFIQPGQTTLSEITAKLGTPDELRPLDNRDGAVIYYHFLDAKYARINYGWPLQFVSPVSAEMIMAGGGLGTDVFQVVFDSNWVAKQHAFAKHMQSNHYKLWPFK